MNHKLEKALQQRLAFMKYEGRILDNSLKFYDRTFGQVPPETITPSQMSAVGNRIQQGKDFKDAKSKVARFITTRMERLSNRETSEKDKSWQKVVKHRDREVCLGDALIEWIEPCKFIGEENICTELDLLAALQRFWDHVHGLYRYRRVFGKPMCFETKEVK